MPTLSQEQIESIADRFSELETEIDSLSDELAEAYQLIESLKAQLLRERAT